MTTRISAAPTRNEASRRDAAELDLGADRAQLLTELGQRSLASMWRLRCEVDGAFRALALKPLEVLTLELLSERSRYPKDVAERLGAAPPVVSALLRDLEAQGLVARALEPSDHRRVRLTLTETGQRTHAQVRRTWLEVQRTKLSRLNVVQLRALRDLQNTLLETQ